MHADIAEAAARVSLPDLVDLAWAYWWADQREGRSRTPSPALTELNDALVRVIAELRSLDRYPQGRLPGDTRQRVVGAGSFDQPLFEDLAAVLGVPDTAELRPAVEAAAESLLSRGGVAKEILLHKALMASEVMRLRVAALLERHGEIKPARHLRRGLDGTSIR